jgi:hypothetical protein
VGAGEGAFLDAEELGFDQLVGQGGAVDGDEGVCRAPAHVVEGARETLLADAGLAQQQDGDLGGRGLVDQRVGAAKARR